LLYVIDYEYLLFQYSLHISSFEYREFFFSGTGNPKFRLNTTLLFEDTTYTNEIKSLINEKLPKWLLENHAYPIEDKEHLHKLKKKEERRRNIFFMRGYLEGTTRTTFNYGHWQELQMINRYQP